MAKRPVPISFITAPIAIMPELSSEPHLSLGLEAQQAGARLIEWRADQVTAPEHRQLVTDLVNQSPLPCIVTCRSATEGGDFEGPEAERIALLQHLLDHAPPAYIDLEAAAVENSIDLQHFIRGSARRQGPAGEASGVAGGGGRAMKSLEDAGVRLILSAHDFAGRPADLYQRLARMNDLFPEASVFKLAWMARSLRDNLEAFEVLRRRPRPMVALCMGEFGLLSRVLAPKFGGMMTFAIPSTEAAATAPGQPTIADLQDRFRFESIGPETRVYGVIGWPVGHSLSPDVHNRAFELANHDGVYLPLPVPTEYEHLKATLGSLLHDPRLDFAGASVTVPHKTQILQIARDWRDGGGDRLQIEIDPLVDEVGAANTVVVRRGDEHAPGSNGLTVALHNTDAPALVTSALAALGAPMKAGRDTDIDGHACPTDLKGLRVAVIGAGGVARAAVAGFSRLGATVVIYNRTFDRAHALAEAFSQLSVQLQGDISEETSADARRRRVVAAQFDRLPRTCAHIIINCTPVGMQGGPAPNGIPVPESALLPASSDDSPRLTPEFGCCRADADDALIGTGRVVVEPAWFNGPTLIFDTIYNPFRTPLLRAAEANGLRTLNGLDMFIRQAAAQFTLWTGREPDQHAMRQAAARRLFEAGEA